MCVGQQYEWTQAAFGLRNSGCVFLHMIKKVLHPIHDFMDNFVNDMTVFTVSDWDTHLKYIHLFMQTIQRSGLTLKNGILQCLK